MKTFLLFFLMLYCFEATSIPFEDGYTHTVIDSSSTLNFNYWDVSCLNNNECLFLARNSLNGAIIYKTIDGDRKSVV